MNDRAGAKIANKGGPRSGKARAPVRGSGAAALGVGALAAPAVFTAVLVLAPLGWAFWGVNGLRSLPATGVFLVVLIALATAVLARIESRNVVLRWAAAIAASWLIAYPLREKIHFLGDTQLRVRTLGIASAGWIPLFSSWWARLHANPLDILVNILGVSALRGLGLSVVQAVTLVSWGLALLFLAGCWRLAGRLSDDRATRLGLAAAVALSGVLVAFAGYAESAGLVAVTTVWWWAEMFAPLSTPGQAWRTTAAFLALALAHRIGIVMSIPLLWRAIGPAAEGDRPEARRAALVLALAAILLVGIATSTSGAGHQLATDMGDLLAAMREGRVHLGDALNALALVAPLAFLAPLVAGRAALREWIRTPGAIAILLAAFPLLIAIEGLYPAASYHLGPEREWEASVMPGLTLTVAGAAILGRLGAARRRALLTVLLPVLGLCAGGWLAANAISDVATRRALAWEDPKAPLGPFQRGYLEAYLGQRAMDEGRPDLGGRHFELAFDSGGNARRALMACEAWLAAGDLPAAHRAMEKARSRGPLGPDLEVSAQRLDEMMTQAAADSGR